MATNVTLSATLGIAQRITLKLAAEESAIENANSVNTNALLYAMDVSY